MSEVIVFAALMSENEAVLVVEVLWQIEVVSESEAASQTAIVSRSVMVWPEIWYSQSEQMLVSRQTSTKVTLQSLQSGAFNGQPPCGGIFPQQMEKARALHVGHRGRR